MSHLRILFGIALIAFTPSLLAANGCGHSTAPPGTLPSASPGSPPEPTPASNPPGASSLASSPISSSPPASASGQLALPPSSAKPWNNAQSDGVAPAVDRSIADYQAIVQNNRDKFRTCYEASLAAHPGIQGRITLKFILNPDGSLKEANIDKAASDILNDDIERCMAGVLKSLSFPSSKRGMESTIRYPFNFKPGSKK